MEIKEFVIIIIIWLIYLILTLIIPNLFRNNDDKFKFSINNILSDEKIIISYEEYSKYFLFNHKIFINYIFLLAIIFLFILYFERLTLNDIDTDYNDKYNQINNYITIILYILLIIIMYFFIDIFYLSKNTEFKYIYNQWGYLYLIIMIIIFFTTCIIKLLNLLLKNDIFNLDIKKINIPILTY